MTILPPPQTIAGSVTEAKVHGQEDCFPLRDKFSSTISLSL